MKHFQGGKAVRWKARIGEVTFEEFCRTVREDQKADLLDGVIYLASPETTVTNDLFCWLFTLIGGFAEEKDLGKVFGQRVALRLNDHNGPEPDIAFIKKENSRRIQRGHIRGPADIAIEIVTPDSVERDYEKKRQKYEEAGVTEYWIVDEELERITLLRLGANGKYREVKARSGEFRSEVLPGFRLRAEWVFGQPRASTMDILNPGWRGPHPPPRDSAGHFGSSMPFFLPCSRRAPRTASSNALSGALAFFFSSS